MSKLLFIITLLLFSSCSNAPENGEATILDKNDTFTPFSKNTEINKSVIKTEDSDKNKTIVVVTPKKKPSISYSGKSSITLTEDETSKINFTLKDGDSNTKILSSSSSESSLFSKNPECSSTGKCSVSFLALKKGEVKITVSLKEYSNEKFQVFVKVIAKEIELKDESLLFTQTSNSLIENNITLEINESINIDFIVKDFNSKTKIKESHNSKLVSTNLDCKSSICQIKITGKSEGSDKINIYVDKNVFVNLKIPINIIELNIPDEVNLIEEKNITEANDTLFGLGEISLDFASGQSTSLNIDEGDDFVITTIITNPRKVNEVISVVSTANKLVEIVSTKIDKNLSDNKKSVFRTLITPLSMGVERIVFRIDDSNLSIALNLTIQQMTCGLSESTYDILQSGVENSQIILGTKFGFNSVEMIYPKINTDSKIEFQNFSYLSDNKKDGVIHSSNSKYSFAFVKFIKDLEGESYKIKYRTDGNSTLKCLSGVFPPRDIVKVEEETSIEEVSPPPQPK